MAKPVFASLDSSKSVLENTANAAPVIVDTNVGLSNPDGTGFGGGTFGVQLTGATASDRLGIAETGDITLSGSQVFYQGDLIGTITQDGVGTTPLAVTLVSGTVSDAAATALARAITFSTSSDTPPTAARALTMAAIDADGTLGWATTKLTVVPEAEDPTNTPPVAVDDTRSTSEDTPLVFAAAELLGNDSDVDGDSLSVSAVSGAVNGTVALDAGQITFTPDADFNGEASFSYTVSDGQGGTDTGTVTVDVGGVNDDPVGSASATLPSGSEDTPYIIAAADLLEGFSDPDGDTLSVANLSASVGALADNGDGTYTLTPPADVNGAVTLSYDVIDGQGGTLAAQQAFTLDPVNDDPVAVDDTRSTSEDTPLVFAAAELLGNDSDVDGDSLSVSAVSSAVNGTVALDAGQITFTPDADFNGEASFSYTVSDGQGGTDTGTVTVDVEPSNAAPVAAPATASGIEDGPRAAVTLSATDSDPGDAIESFHIASLPPNALIYTSAVGGTLLSVGDSVAAIDGSATIYVQGQLTNWNGQTSFSYTAFDGQANSAPATVTVTIAPVNDPPETGPVVLAAIVEDSGPRLITQAELLSSATDVDGDALSAQSLQIASGNGELTANGDGSWSYTPAAGDETSVSFSYEISDGTVSVPASAILDILPENTPPVAGDDNRSTALSSPLTISAASLLGNDSDADGDTLSVTAVSGAVNGTVALDAGQITFTPTTGYRGPASFEYTVSDGHGGTDTASVAISVGANKKPVVSGLDATKSVLENTANAAPVIVDTNVGLNNPDGTGFGGGTFGVQLTGATASDRLGIAETGDITLSGSQVFYQGDLIGTITQDGVGTTPLAVTLVSGTVSDAAATALARAITFSTSSDTPPTAARTLTMAAIDADGTLGWATTKLTVVPEAEDPTNTPPVAVDDTRSASEDTPLVFAAAELLGNDSDVDGDSLSVSAVSGAVNGTVALDAGQITFTPDADFNGEASFSYTVSDGQGGTDTGTVTVDVGGVNDDPVGSASATLPSGSEDTPYIIAAADLLEGFSDPDGDTLSVANLVASVGALADNGDGTYTLTPPADVNGAVTLSYDVIDGQGGTLAAQQAFTLDPVNDDPVAVDDTRSTSEDTPLVFAAAELLGNDSDVDGDSLSVSAVSGAVNGTVALDAGQITFTPDADFNGEASFSYTVSDGQGGTDTGTVTVDVGGVNDDPVGSASATLPSGSEDTPYIIAAADLLEGFSDPDGDTLSVANLSASVGALADNGDGTYTLTPPADVNGAVTLSYDVIDGQGGTLAAQQAFTLDPVNDDPVAVDDTRSTSEDTPLVFAAAELLGNDSDVDGDSLSVSAVSGAVNGTVALDAGQITFTPDADFNGEASFSYTVSDGQGGTDTGTVTVDVGGVNDDPVGSASATLPSGSEDTPYIIAAADLLEGFSDPDGDTLSVANLSASVGALADNGDGTYTLTPPADVNGAVTLSYDVIDGQGGTLAAQQAFTLDPVNDDPVAVDDTRSTSEDTPLVFAAAELLGNDSDVDGDSLSVSAVSGAVNGTVALDAGQITFTPDADFNGEASFSYTVSDGQGGTDTGTVTVDVGGVNDDPVGSASATLPSGSEDTPYIIAAADLLEGFSDPDGDTLSVANLSASVGALADNGDGTYTLTPPADVNGAVTLSYDVIDGQGGTLAAQQAFTLDPVNDDPVAVDDTRSTSEDTPLVFAAAELLGNDSDVDGDSLSVSAVSGAVNGTVALDAGQITFTPDADFNGEASFSYTVSDGQGGTDTGTVTVDVGPENDAPTFLDSVWLGDSGPITRVSTASNGAQANGLSFDPAFSPDGTKLVFYSDADNLVADDTNGYSDIFVKDLVTGEITRVSTDPVGEEGNGWSTDDPVFSPDGTKVAFQSGSSNLVANDTNGAYDIFVKDLVTGDIDRVSTSTAGTQGNGSSEAPIFSPDGTKVAFQSEANDLVSGDSNNVSDIFLKDLQTGELTRISTDSSGNQVDAGSSTPIFSNDGTKILFVSSASNLVADDTNGTDDIFIKDLITGQVTRVSTRADGVEADGTSRMSALSPDGTKVAFVSSATNLVPNDTNGVDDVFVKDLSTGEVTRASTDAEGGQANSTSLYPTFSSDGTKLAFSSWAGNLTPDGAGLSQSDIFIKDLTTGEVTRVSTSLSGDEGNDYSYDPVFSGDGTRVAFWSGASNLVDDDTNESWDIFVKEIALVSKFEAALTDDPQAQTLMADGAVLFADVDAADTHTVAVAPDAGALGTLTATVVPVEGGPDKVEWSYEVDRDLVASLGAGETHEDVFTLTLDDGHGGTATQDVTITLAGTNDAPVGSATATLPAGSEDTAYVIQVADLLAGFTDPDGDTLSVANLSASAGALADNGDGTYTLTPPADVNGAVTLSYDVIDGQGGTLAAQQAFTLDPVNDDPVINSDLDALTSEDQRWGRWGPELLQGAVYDVDGDSLTIISVGHASHGTVALGDFLNEVTYTPDPDFNGQDSFDYTVSDGHGGTVTGTLVVTVTPVNDDPVAVDDTRSTSEDTPLVFAAAELLGNDSDVDGDSLSVSAVSGAVNGTVALDAGQITFTPDADFNGEASFSYTVSDGQGGTDTGTVTVDVGGVNDDPVGSASATLPSGSEDTPYIIAAADLLEGFSDPDGDTLSVANLSASVGALADNGDGTYTLTPPADVNGAVTLSYDVIDGQGGTLAAQQAFTLDPVNDDPVAVDDTRSTSEDTPLVFAAAELLGNDSDVDGDSLSVSAVSGAVNGTVALDAGQITFTPDADFNGEASFSYTVSDGQGGTDTGTVTVDVGGVNDDPVGSASATLPSGSEDTPYIIAAADLLEGFSDPDGDTLNVANLVASAGALADNGDGTYTLTPPADFSGAVTLSYDVIDGQGGTLAAQQAFTLDPLPTGNILLSSIADGSASNDGFKIIGETGSDFAGYSVSGAGDVNGDGLDDLLIGAYGNDAGGSNAGAAYLVYGTEGADQGTIDLDDIASGANPELGFKIIGETASDSAGYSVSGAGDVNGDGLDDLLIGARGNDAGGGNAGAAYVIYGTEGTDQGTIDLDDIASGAHPELGFKIIGETASDLAGYSVSGAGDVNGDGLDDLLIGAYQNDAGGGSAGAAYVIYGTEGSDQGTIDLDDIAGGANPALGFKIVGETANDYAGYSVSGAGDVNGDGLDDLLIGAYQNAAGGSAAGAAYVIYGTEGTDRGTINLDDIASGANPEVGFKIIGETGSDFSGTSVSSAGDVNGDGLDDLLIGARGNDAGGGNAGAAYLVYGTEGTDQGTIDLDDIASGANPELGFKIIGETANDYAGFSVSGAGDVNGDGLDDLLIGAYQNDAGGGSAGAAYVIYGTEGADQGTIDLDDIASGANPELGFKIVGETASDSAGTSVSSAGDVNGDGFDDLLVGAYQNAAGGITAGAAYVIYGGTNGTAPRGVSVATLSENGRAIQIIGETGSDFSGTSVSSAGDVNGDGLDDLLIGARGNDAGGGNAGAAYLVYGTEGTDQGTIDLDDIASGANPELGFKIIGETANDYAGFSVSGAGDVNGDGLDDLLIGAYQNDAGGGSAGAAYVIYGTEGSDQGTIDLDDIAGGANPELGFKIIGETNLDFAGYSVSGAGDINGDGLDDLLIGAYQNAAGGSAAGAAYVIYGTEGTDQGTIDLDDIASGANPELGFKIIGETGGDFTGTSVSSAGDVNGDGLDDLLVGASGNDTGGLNAGAAYVIYGTEGTDQGTFNLDDIASGANPDLGFKIIGEAANDSAGYSVSAAGDVNGDGLGDLLVGASSNSAGGSFAGAAYVIYGTEGTDQGTIDLDDIASGAHPELGFKIVGETNLDYAGSSVSGAGDVNGDGFDDLLIGAYGNEANGNGSGAAYLVFGSDTEPGTIDLDQVALGIGGVKIVGDDANDQFGQSVSAAGDVNADGYADILVGAPNNDLGGTDAGSAYLIYGSNDWLLA